jgi:hypothetical protein
MHGSHRMSNLVSNDFPFSRSPSNYIRTADERAILRVRTRLSLTELTQPCQADRSTRFTRCEECPERQRVVRPLPSPLRKEVETVLNGRVAAARNVPLGRIRWGSWTARLAHNKLRQSKRNVEGLLVKIRTGRQSAVGSSLRHAEIPTLN